jgi:hypothetical protein
VHLGSVEVRGRRPAPVSFRLWNHSGSWKSGLVIDHVRFVPAAGTAPLATIRHNAQLDPPHRLDLCFTLNLVCACACVCVVCACMSFYLLCARVINGLQARC